MSFIIAIDGPAGSGKGTVAKKIAEELHFLNIDTGAMFRCVTLELIKKNISLNEEDKIKKVLENIKISMEQKEGKNIVKLNNEDVTLDIRKEKVNNLVSQVSTLEIVRDDLLNLQRKVAEGKNVIMEGRDIGTKVFPDANVKIYLDATAEERAKRRVKQNIEKGIECSYEEVLENIKNRDKIDSTRKIAPLKRAEDAIYIDSSNMAIDEVVNRIIGIINKKYNK